MRKIPAITDLQIDTDDNNDEQVNWNTQNF